MKNFLFLVCLISGILSANAADLVYPYLTFETTDGKKMSVEVSNLSLMLNGSTLNVGTQSFPLVNLTKMYFSVADETVNGICESVITSEDEIVEFYDLNGVLADKKQPLKGVYVAKMKDGTFKLVLK